ncbi:MAG: OsmC family protein, partial [Solirubrobacteraceae bacterium]|nr:OsmC family protein [Solirubrobacteraceae bacterium]
MKATATRQAGYRHAILIRNHELTVDEPAVAGGTDEGPSPLEMLSGALAGCIAVTMEMYAARKGWELPSVEVEVAFTPAERGTPTKFHIVMRLPDTLTDEQVARLEVIAAKCPV